jgi:hypothetical protein
MQSSCTLNHAQYVHETAVRTSLTIKKPFAVTYSPYSDMNKHAIDHLMYRDIQ